MRWEELEPSKNIEDRRGEDGGVRRGSRAGAGGLGLGTMLLLGAVGWALGINPAVLIGGAQMLNNMRSGDSGAVVERQESRSNSPPSDQMGSFVAKVMGSNEDVWSQILPQQKGIRFEAPKLVLYSGFTTSRCGAAQQAMGPFYCPLDQRIYLDTAFFREMNQRFGGGGDFAYAYVISHEMGHHIENLLGILPKVQQAQARARSRAEANNLSVRVELMADCLAGVWAHNGNKRQRFMEQGDIEKAVASAQAIGDDRLQKAQQGFVVPDSFTHGSAAQRTEWLLKGMQSGTIDACYTFSR
jgi:predicted metalloprotease